ncbi:MAG: 4'-phosphopantetheinyl transferase superfamily protein [Clostridiales bacterium]|jgi:phosphopantetheinyl transferase|nr:4'-phosphopantetheinyl transferase superfamily protein [Clostridiales bacterium]
MMYVFTTRDESLPTDELIRRALKLYAAQTGAENFDAERVRVLKNANGKPYFENLELYFSVAHTRGLKLIVLSHYLVGADVEKIREIDFRRIADRFFTHGEALKVKAARSFFQIWTMKEAYSKYTSYGLASFPTFDVRKTKDVYFTKLDVGRGYSAHAVGLDKDAVYAEL